MKKSFKNTNVSPLLFTLIFIAISIISALLYFNRFKPTVIKLELTQSTITSKAYTLNPNNLKSFEDLLTKYNHQADKEFLITSLETQRNFFIMILTAISILVALVGIFPLIQRYLDKELADKLIETINEAKREILLLKSEKSLTEMQLFCSTMFPGHLRNMVLKDGTSVKNVDNFVLYIKDELKTYIPHIYPESINEKKLIVGTYIICLYKIGADHYKYESNIVSENKILSTIFNYLHIVLDSKNYEIIKQYCIDDFKRIYKEDLIF